MDLDTIIKITAVTTFSVLYFIKYLTSLTYIEGDHKFIQFIGITIGYAFGVWCLHLGGFFECYKGH